MLGKRLFIIGNGFDSAHKPIAKAHVMGKTINDIRSFPWKSQETDISVCAHTIDTFTDKCPFL